ncbi:MAG: protein-glutamate O-methyltransferase [Acidobacteriaceae bacterium]
MPAVDSGTSLYSINERDFQLFRTLIHGRTGIWLRDGKQIMLASRLSRRLRHYGLASFGEYYQLLQAGGNEGEIGELINCVTTNKTSFFREHHHFDFLTHTVIPEILSSPGRSQAKTISVWSGACSTGEEPYSIAITLLEAVRGTRANSAPGDWQIHVTASDIDTKVLETAQCAIYDASVFESVALDLQKRYFLRGKDNMEGRIKVKDSITSLVRFQRLNLMDAVWPVEGPFDVIFFRNALIYFQQETQDTFLRRMARLLRPRGYLFLGHSEHIPWLHDLLEPLNRTMYRLRDHR